MPRCQFHPDPPFGPGQGAPGQAAPPRPVPASPPMTPPRPPVASPPLSQPRPVAGPGNAGPPQPIPQPPRANGPGAVSSAPGAPAPAAPGTRLPGAPTDAGSPKIRALEQKLGGVRHEDGWQRSPNATGTGAIHVRSFHCKLTGDALENLDRQINEWLDAHPQYEVKLATTAVGEWLGKLKEPNLIVQVWV